MRLSFASRSVRPDVCVVYDSTARPLRIDLGGIIIRLNVDEAIELANQLVDNAETVKTQGREQL